MHAAANRVCGVLYKSNVKRITDITQMNTDESVVNTDESVVNIYGKALTKMPE